MKYKYSKRSIAIVCALTFGALFATSCHNDSSDLSAQYVEDLQKQLDSTMKLYIQVKSDNASFDSQLASRDSAIQAQAKEIQRLIDQVNSKQGRKSDAVASNPDSRQLEAQRKEIKEKESKIKQLQQQLDQQAKQLQKLQNTQTVTQDNSKYESQIASLQKQIKQQEAQIARLSSTTSASSNCDQVRQSYEGQVSSLNNEIGGYKTQIAELRDQIKSLKAMLTTCQNNLASQQSGSADDAEALKSLRDELSQATAQLNECRKLNTQYQKDVKQAKDSLLVMKKVANSHNTQNENTKLIEENAHLQQTIAQCEESRSALQSKLDELQKRVSTLTSTVESLTVENNTMRQTLQQSAEQDSKDSQTIAQLQLQVASQQQQIEYLQNQLENQKRNLDNTNTQTQNAIQQNEAPTKGNLDKKMAELQALCNEYIAEIERLRAENAQLKSENAELRDKIGQSGDLIAENERLQQKVKLASILVTSDVIATPGKNVKTGNIVTPTNKAAKTNVVRIDCRLLDNNVIDPGSVTIYARIANAANRVVCNGALENYSFDLNGIQMQYTTKQDIEFTGYGRNLTMLWRRSEATEMPAGLYWVTLYANGYEIGKTSFKLD